MKSVRRGTRYEVVFRLSDNLSSNLILSLTSQRPARAKRPLSMKSVRFDLENESVNSTESKN